MGPNMPWMPVLEINTGTNQCNMGKRLQLIELPLERRKKLSIKFTINTTILGNLRHSGSNNECMTRKDVIHKINKQQLLRSRE